MVRVAFLVFLGCVLGSCLETHECTDIGCVDQANFTIRTASGAWEAGEYSLSVTFDDVVHTCSFTLPDDLPAQGSLDALDCTPRLDAYIQQESMCMEYRNGDSVSQSCTPIPDQYSLSGWFYGTPSTLAVSLERDGAELVEETHSLSYEESRPNGPECDPICRQASVDIAIP
jgi:hypothetical protein